MGIGGVAGGGSLLGASVLFGSRNEIHSARSLSSSTSNELSSRREDYGGVGGSVHSHETVGRLGLESSSSTKGLDRAGGLAAGGSRGGRANSSDSGEMFSVALGSDRSGAGSASGATARTRIDSGGGEQSGSDSRRSGDLQGPSDGPGTATELPCGRGGGGSGVSVGSASATLMYFEPDFDSGSGLNDFTIDTLDSEAVCVLAVHGEAGDLIRIVVWIGEEDEEALEAGFDERGAAVAKAFAAAQKLPPTVEVEVVEEGEETEDFWLLFPID